MPRDVGDSPHSAGSSHPATAASQIQGTAAPDTAVGDGWADELAAIFAVELQDHLRRVPALMTLLTSRDTQSTASADLAQIFHTIKGSAAVIGRTDVSTLAKQLQDSFTGVAEAPGPQTLSPAFLATTQATLARLGALADQPPPHPAALSTGAAAADSSTDENAEPIQEALLDAFRIDAVEAIAGSERLLLRFEQQPDTSLLEDLLRQFHTLKGAAAAVGIHAVVQRVHLGESLLDGILKGKLSVDAGRIVDLLLELIDSLSAVVTSSAGDDGRGGAGILDEIATLLASTTIARSPAEIHPYKAPAQVPEPNHGVLVPHGQGDGSVLRVPVARLNALQRLVDDLVSRRATMEDHGRDLIDAYRKLRLLRSQLTAVTRETREASELALAPRLGSRVDAGDGNGRDASSLEPFTRGDFDRCDGLTILARRMVELATNTSEIATVATDAVGALDEELRHVSAITHALRQEIGALSSVSLHTLFRRLARPVRDAARQTGKSVDLACDGGELRMDGAVVDRLYPILLHLVRNAVAHGIERPAVRQASGKPPRGSIRITARPQRRGMQLTVCDDGAGLDFDAILHKGRSLGLLPADTEPHRAQLGRLILSPGFSTSETVTEISGRGIGMDIVARDVAALNGTLHIESRDQEGVTIGITLPPIPVVEEFSLLQTGTRLFALPTAVVDHVATINVAALPEGRPPAVTIRDLVVPALLLGPLVGESPPLDPAVAVLVRAAGRMIALIGDRVESPRQTVLRPLGPMLDGHPLFDGAIISGSGTVILALHVAHLVELLGTAGGPAREIASAACATPGPRGPAILFVDDSITVRRVAERFLAAGGFHVHTAVDGVDALEKLRAGGFRAVVTDLEMPRMHGYELIAAIRDHPQHRYVPIIVCSSRSSDQHHLRARAAGAQGYLTKPFTSEQLLAMVRRHMAPLASEATTPRSLEEVAP